MASLVARWRADLDATDAGAGKLSDWGDQTDSFDLAQATGANQPTIIASGINSRQVIRFARSNQERVSRAATPTQTAPWTIVAVLQDAGGAGDRLIAGDPASGNGYGVYRQGGGNLFGYAGGSGITGATTLDSDPHWIAFVADGASSALYLDGVAESLTGSTASPGLAGFTVGAFSDGGFAFGGDIGEVRLYDGDLFADPTALAALNSDLAFWGLGSDTTAPVLSNATAAATGQTTADLTVDTDESGGTLFWVVTQSATPPSGAQVAAGQDETGAAAVASGSQAVSAAGMQSIAGGATGLAAGTAYWAYFAQDDAAANRSAVAASSSFATDAAVAPVVPIASAGDGGGGHRHRRRRYPYPNIADDGWDWEERFLPPDRTSGPESPEQPAAARRKIEISAPANPAGGAGLAQVARIERMAPRPVPHMKPALPQAESNEDEEWWIIRRYFLDD